MLKISINNNFTKIPSDTIGIDMGHSLSKFAYLEEKDLSLSCFSTQTNIESINYFINSKKDLFNVFNFTGGKSFKLYNEYLKDFDSYLLNEFEANVKGVEFLYTMEKKRKLSRSLVVTVGTGTSIVLKNDGVQHLGGSALGGGFFMGILKALFNFNDFHYDNLQIDNDNLRTYSCSKCKRIWQCKIPENTIWFDGNYLNRIDKPTKE